MIVIEKSKKMYYKDVIFDPESEKCLSMDSTFTDLVTDYFEAHA